MITEKQTFNVSYCGTEEALQKADEIFQQSFEGIEGVINDTYRLFKRDSDGITTITVETSEIPSGTPKKRSFDVTVTAEHEKENQYSLEKILQTIGFLGQQRV